MKPAMADYAASDADNVTVLRLLLFRLEQECYAIPLLSVREVMRYREYTLVPGAPPTLPGIISQRGAILAVVNLRALLGLTEAALGGAARFVIVQHDAIDMALQVEQVFDLVDIPLETAEPVPQGLDPSRAALLSGVVRHDNQLVAVLDLDTLCQRLREEGER